MRYVVEKHGENVAQTDALCSGETWWTGSTNKCVISRYCDEVRMLIKGARGQGGMLIMPRSPGIIRSCCFAVGQFGCAAQQPSIHAARETVSLLISTVRKCWSSAL
jgi:hypothetical protein